MQIAVATGSSGCLAYPITPVLSFRPVAGTGSAVWNDLALTPRRFSRLRLQSAGLQ